MSMEPGSRKCGDCDYFSPTDGDAGVCLRYPSPVVKSEHNWCGEHSRSRSAYRNLRGLYEDYWAPSEEEATVDA